MNIKTSFIKTVKAGRKIAVPFFLEVLFVLLIVLNISGCLSVDVPGTEGLITAYQAELIRNSPQDRATSGLDPLMPPQEPNIPTLEIKNEKESGKKRIDLPIEGAVMRTLANSPEIAVIGFDPSIAKEGVTEAVSEFDIAGFGTLSFEKEKSPVDSYQRGGKTDTRLWETGIKQKGITGMEWSLSYGLSRNWDDLITRNLEQRYKPMLVFQVKQPLLRDGWFGVNLANVDKSKINYKIALAEFRQETEKIAAKVISTYWTLYEARRDLEIQKDLLDEGIKTLEKVKNRKDIDATMLQIKQTEVSVKMRKTVLLQLQKKVVDIQDSLVKMVSDHQLNLLDDFDLVPVSIPSLKKIEFNRMDLLKTALNQNPELSQTELKVKLARIDLGVADWQKLPKLNLVASARLEGMDDSMSGAHNSFDDGKFASYSVGVTFEYPFGNRKRKSQYRQMEYKLSQSVSALQAVRDRLAAQTKEGIRKANMTFEQIQVQKEAVKAAEINLQGLEDTEAIREKLTPEFLLVKLQAQESLASSRKSEVQAIVSYNVALVQIALATGTVLDMRHVKEVIPGVKSSKSSKPLKVSKPSAQRKASEQRKASAQRKASEQTKPSKGKEKKMDSNGKKKS